MHIKFCFFFIVSLVSLLPSMAKGETGLFPTAADRYWKKSVPAAMRNDYIQQGNKYMGRMWEPISPSLFAEFRTTGNRTNFEQASFTRRRRFAVLVMAEVMQQKRRFMGDIRRGIHYFIEKEPWWGLPAHYPKDHPERDLQVVDLFNAETAAMLAWTVYMLGDEMEKEEPGLADSVKSEISRRFLIPTLYNKQGWKDNANNWNTWITSNWLECAIICENDEKRLAEAINGVKQNLKFFLRQYPDDGGCEEGVDYWDRAAGSFFESLFFLDAIGKPLSLNAAQKAKVNAMGRYLTTMHISDLSFVNFSDAKSRYLPNINILFPYGRYMHDDTMMEFAAYIGKKHQYLTRPTYLFQRTGNYPTLSRELMLLSMISDYKNTKSAEPQTIDRFLKDSQVMVASTDPSARWKHSWLIAAKGGHNGESHNHNDIGNFVVYYDNQPVVIDLGRDTYTAQTFGSARYELPNNRSAYHNVPIINGLEQSTGRRYKATNVTHKANDSISVMEMNIEKAYPKESYATSWHRSIALDRIHNRVEITETYSLDSIQIDKDRQTGEVFDNKLVLMCYGKPVVSKKGVIQLLGGKVSLTYDARLVSASVEKLQMSEGIMKKQWNDNVYRIMLRLNDNYPKATVKYRFASLR